MFWLFSEEYLVPSELNIANAMPVFAAIVVDVEAPTFKTVVLAKIELLLSLNIGVKEFILPTV